VEDKWKKIFIKRQQNGITLIALVITIIILLILAGISIEYLVENGILKKTEQAKEDTTKAQIKDELERVLMEAEIEKNSNPEYDSNEFLTKFIKERISITSINENSITIDEWKFIIDREKLVIIDIQKSVDYEINNDAILGKINNITKSGYYEIEITGKDSGGIEETKKYDFHVIVYNGNLVLDGINNVDGMTLLDNIYEVGDNTTDVATSSTYAQNTVVFKIKGDLTINEGITLTACKSDNGYGGPKGMIIYCTGTIKNNGTISMTARGANAEGENVYLWKNQDESYEYVPAIGATGGNNITVTSSSYTQKVSNYYLKKGSTGDEGSLRKTGGGGSGGARTNSGKATSGAGGTGTSYSGGSGGGATATYTQISKGNAASDIGGNGGNAVSLRNGTQGEYASGGGVGNPGGSGYASGNINTVLCGANGTGGLLIIFSDNIINNSIIESNGTDVRTSSWGAVGGASGAGSINIFTKQFKNNGSILAEGGKSNNTTAGNGGNGSVTIGNISTGSFIKEN